MDTKTVAEHLAEIDADAEQAIAKARARTAAERAILSGLPPGLAVNGIHASTLYGERGHVSIGNEYRQTEPNHQSRAAVLDLLRQFPPMPREIVRDGCTSIRLAGFVDGHDRPTAERTPIFPVTVSFENLERGQVCTVEWITDLHAATGSPEPKPFPVRLSVLVDYASRPGRFSIDARRDRSTGTLLEIKRVDWHPAPGVNWRERINYGGGGLTDPGHKVFYWTDAPDGNAADVFAELWPENVPAARASGGAA